MSDTRQPENPSQKIDWGREAVLTLVEEWGKIECLYNSRHTWYHNKKARHGALSTICKKLKVYYPNITVHDVKVKINYLRSQYCREKQRLEMLANESITDEIYHPITVYWYDKLAFLDDYIKMRKRKYNTSDTNKENPKTSEVGPSSSNACTGLDNASIEEQPVDKIDIKDETYYFPSYGNSPSASQLDDYSQEEFRPPQISDPKKCNKRKRQIYEDDLSNPDLMTLKKNKLQLEIYNLRLDALKKEIDLGLPRSQFTEELYKNWDDVPIKEET
ncbi:uncharacterized protein LOC129911143 isoform X1 [Episyrphus balteatus]|uniref:uncharacterized protein LOC129911143 isoform X1 n=1 Tax=Episyrphus balteatus TaxID=286459 RepID=UPI002484DCD3|nr:uncharacterized protein LOC129911143 isoform X1 [Episyrphus balteatus]